jgi:hypothetical protein
MGGQRHGYRSARSSNDDLIMAQNSFLEKSVSMNSGSLISVKWLIRLSRYFRYQPLQWLKSLRFSEKNKKTIGIKKIKERTYITLSKLRQEENIYL